MFSLFDNLTLLLIYEQYEINVNETKQKQSYEKVQTLEIGMLFS